MYVKYALLISRDKIRVGNSHMVRHIKTTKPYYDRRHWSADYKRSSKIMKQLIEHDYDPKVLRRRRQSSKVPGVKVKTLLPDEYVARQGPGADALRKAARKILKAGNRRTNRNKNKKKNKNKKDRNKNKNKMTFETAHLQLPVRE